MAENNWELELNEYIRQGEPDKVDKSNAQKTAIGLQDVDGLKPSAYLIETAKEHIEGKITIAEADKRIHGISEMHWLEQITMIGKMVFMLLQNFWKCFLKIF